jgi:hypothetical protein
MGTSSKEIESFGPASAPYGISYGQWTVRWWKWFLSTPKSVNPVLDSSGECASVNQPPSQVWFLGGKLGDQNLRMPNRSCVVPVGRAILIPVINCEANSLEYPQLETYQDLRQHVRNDEDTIAKKECFVNGVSIPVQRVESEPAIFEITLPENNIIDVHGGVSTVASGDGYWVFLKPLPRGKYSISFSGSCEKGRLNSGANYNLEVC